MESIVTVVGSCTLKRSPRRTLSISVLPDETVEIVAPLQAAIPAIQKKIAKRSSWIRRQRRFFSTLRIERSERRFCSGATHKYLGRQYRLKITTREISGVKLFGAYLNIFSCSRSERTVAQLLSGWIKARAREQFEKRLKKWRQWCAALKLPNPTLHLRDMPKRWGSAHLNGRIYLNPELVRAPSICIDYVIAHEICHLKHPKHDKAFYAELEKLFPRWRETKLKLERADS